MSSFLFYILKSTIGISLLYGGFRFFMRKETFFALNRAILLAIVLVSTVIPLISLPPLFQSIVIESRNSAVQQPEINPIVSSDFAQPENATTETISTPYPLARSHFSWATLIQYLYWAGILITFLILIHGIGSVLVLFKNATTKRINGYKVVIVDREVSPFSFAKIIVISRADYENHRQSILTHEQAHIQLNHFFDLALLEAVKIFHWFNPFIYLLIKDMKEIHEFQADENTLNSGIDAKQYQYLIIQKSVGNQRFALANSFNHCQIKKRITMMNKSKTSKAWRWKVATFLPLLALLLMAFGKTGENATPKQPTQAKQWTASDFGKPVYDNTTTRAMLGTPIDIDSQSKISIRDKPATLDNITAIARMNFDYNRADDKLKNEFMKMTINGQERMFQRYCLLHVFSHSAASPQVLQTVLNAIGKAAEETRQYYALDLFKTDYEKLLSTQKTDIDKLVPAIVVVQNFPIGNPTSEAITNAFTAEIKAEGIIVPPSEKVISTVELKKQIESFATGKSNPIVNVKTATGLNGDLLNKVKDALKTVKNINVSYTEFEPVYTLVDQMPEFPDGVVACRNWVAKNTQYPQNSNIEGKVFVAFVVNTKGKVVSPSIAKGLDTALDKEAVRVISAMPLWKPGVQNGIPVCVKYTIPVNFVKK